MMDIVATQHPHGYREVIARWLTVATRNTSK